MYSWYRLETVLLNDLKRVTSSSASIKRPTSRLSPFYDDTYNKYTTLYESPLFGKMNLSTLQTPGPQSSNHTQGEQDESGWNSP